MKQDKYSQPRFTLSLLHPKYWGVWLGFGSLALIVTILPYSALFKLGQGLGTLSMRFGKKRIHIARRNMELSFPEKSAEDIEEMVVDNFKNTGLALIETGIAWFWPTWRFKRLIIAKDIDLLYQYKAKNQGVLLCCVHALNLEITARGFAALETGIHGYGVFRPHNNPAYNFIQFWGRTHDGNKLVDRKDIKQMIRVMREGELLFYLPDHDYGRNKSVFVPFFSVEDACTTTGTSILAYTSKCAIVMGSGFRNEDGKYEIITNVSVEDNYPQKDEKAAAAYMNKYIEMLILRAPTQWMWLHKRFKTMEDPNTPKGIRYQ